MFRSALRHEYHTETRKPWSGCTRSSTYTVHISLFYSAHHRTLLWCMLLLYEAFETLHSFPFPSLASDFFLLAGFFRGGHDRW